MKNIYAVYVHDLDGVWKLVSLWDTENHAKYMCDVYDKRHDYMVSHKTVPMEIETVSLFDEEYNNWFKSKQ